MFSLPLLCILLPITFKNQRKLKTPIRYHPPPFPSMNFDCITPSSAASASQIGCISCSSMYSNQKPYDVPLQDRYKNGLRRFWVYNNDKPFKPDSPTRPRTEVRITGYDYTSGVWQFEGYAFVPKGTSGATIVQILGGAQSATTLQLRIYNGDIRYYSSKLVATDLYDKWFRVNIIPDVGNGKVSFY
ncbi:hypothetical protein I3760_01G075300 [Carya illinoinensis]|nr:hypothetical protein I3760_01G075300 [Carya illinoinensis]